ncbi:MoaD/ThiS family protein [Salinirubrum litoreum]|uniref:MoaD/ThiS family protein n=1 Tax=Salinirubrum litoreum TaxID=1126234 RepID=A0ABD5RBE0_9EURY|nr:MoaD/ThiS family protein [Salinirubrum litoreum]
MEFEVYGPLRSSTGGKTATVAFEGGTVEEALWCFLDAYPRATQYLLTDDEDPTFRPSVRVVVDGEKVDLDEHLDPDATLTLIPAVQGGRR